MFDRGATYVLGLPVTEPYWIRAIVSGVERDVLLQLFERRVLTYTPSNPTGSKVEMGNVGQHYFRWRHQSTNTNSTAQVLNLSSQAQLSSYNGPCPATINLSGESKAGGVGKFYWRFYNSIFGSSDIYYEDLMLDGGYIEHSFTGTITSSTSVSGWDEIVVYEPQEMLSNRADFQINCT